MALIALLAGWAIRILCMSLVGAEPYNATIIAWNEVANGLAIFRVRPDGGQVPLFEPGQYATLGLPRDHPPVEDPHEFPPGDPRWKKLWRRDYSIASPATCRDHLEFYAVRVGGGRLTEKLWLEQEGGRLWLDSHIRGDFTLRGVPSGRTLVMVATGTGLGPYMSMIRTYRGADRWRRLVLIHGVRRFSELGYHSELRDLAAQDSSILYLPICSREPPDSTWTGGRGRVTDLLHAQPFEQLVGFALSPVHCSVFLCGNPAMIRDAEAILTPQGFTTHTRKRAGNLHAEQYW